MSVTFLREEGVLKRVRGTPLPPTTYLLGRVLHGIFLAYLLVAIVALFGAVFYGVDLPTGTLPAFLLAIVRTKASCVSLLLGVSCMSMPFFSLRAPRSDTRRSASALACSRHVLVIAK